jgi:2-amino-4-hydroxy-6-hydroxymethyldihydropteridine diphosphokinase
MVQVALSLGSNVEPGQHIAAALDALSESFGPLILSSVYESEAVGFDGDNFLNMVALGHTDLSLAALAQWLKQLEEAQGRRRQGQARFSSRTLDVDVLIYADWQGEFDGIVLPRPEITENAFVLRPMAEVAGAWCDPRSGLSYAALWQAYDRSLQHLWPIDFHWQGRQISRAAGP